MLKSEPESEPDADSACGSHDTFAPGSSFQTDRRSGDIIVRIKGWMTAGISEETNFRVVTVLFFRIIHVLDFF